MKTNVATYRKHPRSIMRLTVMLALTIAQPSLVQAKNVQAAYTMMAIVDSAHGSLVTKGEFSDAIQNLAARELKPFAFEAHNNLCISYTKTGDLEKATVACDAAVAARANAKRNTLRRFDLTKRQFMREKAVALSNRGVFRAISGDVDGARDDFAMSVLLDRQLDYARANLNHLETVASISNATAQY